MSHKNDEADRLKRIRDRQVGLRDPQVKQQRLQSGIASRRRKSVKEFSSRQVVREIPYKARGALIGAFIGVLILAFTPLIIDSPWTNVIGILSIVMLTIFGFFMGRALDARDRLKELIGK
jgi:VIT1/CCC1 family predicted Fe2+/Mn2+ transporter